MTTRTSPVNVTKMGKSKASAEKENQPNPKEIIVTMK
jgi:hypothetical protein